MRIIWIPTDPATWIVSLAILVLMVIGFFIFRMICGPSAVEKQQNLLKEDRYQKALMVYVANLGSTDPTWDDRRAAAHEGVRYLVNDHAVPREEADRNVQLLMAAYDRDRSYELRQLALQFEEAGDFNSALDHFERAAQWQKEHDLKDYQFLQRCAARVRKRTKTK